jgi:hypothetical protein
MTGKILKEKLNHLSFKLQPIALNRDAIKIENKKNNRVDYGNQV